MSRSIAQLEALILEALEPGFRGRLVARGLARNLIWSEGIMPEGAVEFAPSLTNDLLGYGLSLLRIGLELRALESKNPVAGRAFERAAEAIESVVKGGDPEWEGRGFYTVLAATAYHLGHFSARAFSLLPSDQSNLNLNPCEKTLTYIIRRDFTAISREIEVWTQAGGFDATLAYQIENAPSDAKVEGDGDDDGDDDFSIDHAFSLVQSSIFHKAIAIFDYGLEIGNRNFVDDSLKVLSEGITASSEFNSVPFWWMFTVTYHLIEDLWDYSFHVQLPIPDNAPDNSEWTNLRRLYIAELQRRGRAEIDLWPSQLSSAARAIDIGDDLVAALPTSAGKTRIAEMCILRAVSLQQRVVFVTPLRALSAQTERSLKETFVPLGFSVSSLYGSSGSTGDDLDSLKNRDIVVSTPEKLDFALRNDPSLFDDVGLVVFDEAHTIGANEREVRYEVLVQRLLRRSDADLRRIVCLSAILPQGQQLNDFLAWIRQDQEGDAISCDWRPTRQRFGEITWNDNRALLTFRVEEESPYVDPFFTVSEPKGRRRKLFPDNLKELGLASVWRLVEDRQTVLLYSPQRSWVIPLAAEAVNLHQKGYLASLLPQNADFITDAYNIGKEWLGEFHPAVQCLKIGVAVHHAQLPRPFLRAVEQLLRSNKLKVTIASPTLAQGLNLSATTVLFYALTRSGQMIPGEEFANVAGRAGRAFVDVEGRVLCLAPTRKHFQNWERLLKASRNRDIRSGLYRLIIDFCLKIAEVKGLALDNVINYVMGNAAAWEAPALVFFATDDKEGEQESFENKWESDLASIDSAILSMVQQDVELDSIATEIDAALTGSLWQRTLSHETETTQKVSHALLIGRAKYLWSNTTPLQRKGYFFAGISFKTGQFLDENAQSLNQFLDAADVAIVNSDLNLAISALISFSEIIFLIEPFSPGKVRDDWREILARWIRGESLADLSGGQEEKIIEFIEGALVYRLVWALEAVRVRNTAHNPDDEKPAAGRSSLAVETGTGNVQAALLIQAGVPSRVAAMKAVHDCSATFTDTKGLRKWLVSTAVKAAMADSDWPTPEAHHPWIEFTASFKTDPIQRWGIRTFRFESEWRVEPPPSGTAVKLLFNDHSGDTDIFSVEMEHLGRVNPSFERSPSGVIVAKIAKNFSIDVEYLGPSDITVPAR